MLKITNLQKTFNPGTVNAKTALDGLNLHIKEGDFVTVIGGNGAGKSTLQNAIAGVWKPDFGTIEIDGVDVTNMPEHKRAAFLGRVFQDPMKGTAPDMEIAENLAIAHGNRLIMMQDGHIIVDVEGEEKKKLTVEDLLKLFAQASGQEFTSDRAILS